MRRKWLTKPERGSEKMKAKEEDQGSTNAMYLDSDSDSDDDVDDVTLACIRATLVILRGQLRAEEIAIQSMFPK
ncbi:hypothetical protein HYC85_019444 [Camellia sinensis]|uniref:Uncharacterized protein n=1 Tax=Camellia sinensis TaxID=4442 RepID=A0A7J7GLV6_CAMSI|nr:hypothetical protein HYC85_019444 [Camellia sinensis]